jgi:HemX protein
MAEILFWPTLLFYGEAAVGYLGYLRRAGAADRAAIWGVRLGWLAQTALLIVQATRENGFPWGTWAGSLNLFVWLVVTVYLGVRKPYRLLGLAVMPLAAALLIVSRAGGGTGAGSRSHYSNVFLVLHVGLVLAAFAGFTLAAALAVLYLLEERRLQRHAPDILRLRLPSLVVLERVTLRTIAISLPLLTVGLIAGFIRLRRDGGGVDALMAATIVTWLVYAVFLAVRPTGRRAAHVALLGFAFVILVRLALAGSHF